MKNYAKIGGRKGKPAYRTPSRFIARQVLKNKERCLLKSRPFRKPEKKK